MTSLKVRADDWYLLYEQDSSWSVEVEVSDEFAEGFRKNWKEFFEWQRKLSAIERQQRGKQK